MKEYKYVIKRKCKDNSTIYFNILTRGLTRIPADIDDEKEIIQKLKENYILIDDADSLNKYIHNKLKYPTESRLIVIDAWTFDCNLACTYCMQQNVRKNSYPILKPEERVNIWDQIRKILRKDYMDILLFGGEPFYDPSYIEKMLSLAKDISLPIRAYSAITNGVFVNSKKVIDIIDNYDFQYVQITLDGPPDIHDSRRILLNGSGTFNKIIDNINLLLKYTNTRIVVHTVIDNQNWKYYGKLLDILIKHFKNDIYNLRMVFNIGMESHPSSPCNYTITNIPTPKKYATIYLKAIKEVINRGLPIISFLSESICTYNKENEVIVGPDGGIYKCTSAIGVERFKVVSKEILFTKPELFLLKYAIFIEGSKGDASCLHCEYFPVCGGGCVYNAWVENKEKDCWIAFHEITLPEFAKILLDLDEVEPNIWIPSNFRKS